MTRRRHSKTVRLLTISSVSILLICAAVGGLQPLLDKILGGGTLLAMKASAEEQHARPSEANPTPQSASKGETGRQPEQPTREAFQNDPLSTIAVSLQNKQHELAERERRLKEGEDRLELLRSKVEQDLAKIEQERADFKRMMDEFQTQQDAKRAKDVKKWFEIYQSLTPDKAAAVLEEMEPSTARDILSKMDSKKATKILGSMKQDKAKELVGTGLQKGNR